ncbi:MAG TPA: ABC transporter ATP-binding protein [Elusimicrobiales bacterium]|nr:ABC transporter ATP-binding protein [Elusimicrobiales bacterium]HOL63217.1 ABC transporter ATP-binding protein [Elusimicrobiales bacterium]HPO95970.1 ABC transporter ATP-binding protein [Elusimicrobiales bacterium]
MLKIENLTKKFGNFTAVDSVNLDIKEGEVFGFLGPNGAGKTTTVKIISGILKPTSGSVSIDGVDVINNPIESKKMISYIPDEPFVYPYLTAREFLRFISEVYKIENYNDKIDELLSFFGLLDYADLLLSSYSHGMKQKLLIASVVLRNPKVMLFDEPTVGLDPLSVKKFKELIKRLTLAGTSVFMCTHILEMAEKICDQVAVINKGKIIASGKVKDIIGHDKDKNLEDVFLELTS